MRNPSDDPWRRVKVLLAGFTRCVCVCVYPPHSWCEQCTDGRGWDQPTCTSMVPVRRNRHRLRVASHPPFHRSLVRKGGAVRWVRPGAAAAARGADGRARRGPHHGGEGARRGRPVHPLCIRVVCTRALSPRQSLPTSPPLPSPRVSTPLVFLATPRAAVSTTDAFGSATGRRVELTPRTVYRR